MSHSSIRLLAVLLVAACGQEDPGTSVRVALIYDDGLGLETADVTVDNRTESGPIAHELLVLVPDELDGVVMPMEVWARKDGERTAYGTTTAVPELDATVTASVTLTACTPACNGDMLTTCTGPVVECALGCSEDGDAHCIVPKPSNGVDPAEPTDLRTTITISADTTFDVDTGTITGGLVRSGVSGVEAGVGYLQSDGVGGGARLGIFVFHNLTVESTAKVQFTGTRAVVLLIGETAKIAGALDLSAGRDARATGGPGGGAGGSLNVSATGCGPGGPGSKGVGANMVDDSGGAGGGAGTAGGTGGESFNGLPGGVAGLTCLPLELEPLQGGSGGGAGSPGAQPTPAVGGGGGGAIQITSLGSLEITGTINAGGAGGEGGASLLGTMDAGSGGGGGSGGAILLEAPTMTIATGAILAANGGGGGASGTNTSTPGAPGQNAAASLTPAPGGFPISGTNGGGAGGAGTIRPIAGGSVDSANGGGGGGAVGTIVIRARKLTNTGTFSPAPMQTDVKQ